MLVAVLASWSPYCGWPRGPGITLNANHMQMCKNSPSYLARINVLRIRLIWVLEGWSAGPGLGHLKYKLQRAGAGDPFDLYSGVIRGEPWGPVLCCTSCQFVSVCCSWGFRVITRTPTPNVALASETWGKMATTEFQM